jgi:putative transposase
MTKRTRRPGAARAAAAAPKRGPKSRYPGVEFTLYLRRAIEESPFTGEGYRKVGARLCAEAHPRRQTAYSATDGRSRTSHPLAGAVRVLGPRHHEGTILPEAPNAGWGTDVPGPCICSSA